MAKAKKKPTKKPIKKPETDPVLPVETKPAEKPEPIDHRSTDYVDPRIFLMQLVWKAWLSHQLDGLMYRMTRTFEHHRRNENYGTHIIFEQLESLNKGKHAEMLKQYEAFHKTLFEELDNYIDDNPPSK
jgi:hypothetical protein